MRLVEVTIRCTNPIGQFEYFSVLSRPSRMDAARESLAATGWPTIGTGEGDGGGIGGKDGR